MAGLREGTALITTIIDGFSNQAHMEQGRVVPLDSSLAIDAAVFGLKYKLPLADSIIYATGNKFSAVVWTQDADFKALPNVKYFPKVNTT